MLAQGFKSSCAFPAWCLPCQVQTLLQQRGPWTLTGKLLLTQSGKSLPLPTRPSRIYANWDQSLFVHFLFPHSTSPPAGTWPSHGVKDRLGQNQRNGRAKFMSWNVRSRPWWPMARLVGTNSTDLVVVPYLPIGHKRSHLSKRRCSGDLAQLIIQSSYCPLTSDKARTGSHFWSSLFTLPLR